MVNAMLGHEHHSHHGHSHGPDNYDRAFAIGVALNLAYVVVEAGFGLRTSSLALLADAGHNLSDVLSLLLAWAANHLSRLKPSKRRTYGAGPRSSPRSSTPSCFWSRSAGSVGKPSTVSRSRKRSRAERLWR
jgi:hypothetical protein